MGICKWSRTLYPKVFAICWMLWAIRKGFCGLLLMTVAAHSGSLVAHYY